MRKFIKKSLQSLISFFFSCSCLTSLWKIAANYKGFCRQCSKVGNSQHYFTFTLCGFWRVFVSSTSRPKNFFSFGTASTTSKTMGNPRILLSASRYCAEFTKYFLCWNELFFFAFLELVKAHFPVFASMQTDSLSVYQWHSLHIHVPMFSSIVCEFNIDFVNLWLSFSMQHK